jgi:hypothetical protein
MPTNYQQGYPPREQRENKGITALLKNSQEKQWHKALNFRCNGTVITTLSTQKCRTAKPKKINLLWGFHRQVKLPTFY